MSAALWHERDRSFYVSGPNFGYVPKLHLTGEVFGVSKCGLLIDDARPQADPPASRKCQRCQIAKPEERKP